MIVLDAKDGPSDTVRGYVEFAKLTTGGYAFETRENEIVTKVKLDKQQAIDFLMGSLDELLEVTQVD